MFKNILIIGIISLIAVSSWAQETFHVSTTYATEQGTINREVAPSVVLRNLTHRAITIHWAVEQRNLSEGWQAVVCDHQCYTPSTEKRSFKLQPGEVLQDFKVSFRPNGKEGMGHVEVVLYDENNPSKRKTITFSGAAKSTNSSLIALAAQGQVPNIYPNPVTEFMRVQDDYSQVKYIEIYNVVGRKLQSFSVNYLGQKYDVSHLPRGIYMVRMMDEQGTILRTQRISKYNP